MTLSEQRPLRLSCALPLSMGSPKLARTVLQEALPRVPEDTVETAQLLVSELVTNAVLHAESLLALEVETTGNSLRVTVEDLAHDLPRPEQPDAETGTSGRGLLIVEALASSWGWERTATGKRVWFELSGDAGFAFT